jgi:hypothetical protein
VDIAKALRAKCEFLNANTAEAQAAQAATRAIHVEVVIDVGSVLSTA